MCKKNGERNRITEPAAGRRQRPGPRRGAPAAAAAIDQSRRWARRAGPSQRPIRTTRTTVRGRIARGMAAAAGCEGRLNPSRKPTPAASDLYSPAARARAPKDCPARSRSPQPPSLRFASALPSGAHVLPGAMGKEAARE